MPATGRPPDTQNALSELLSQKERDLELAAKIGQSLLEQNKELQNRNEFLEENLATSTDTVVQLKHELNRRVELLRMYSHYDDDTQQRSEDTSFRHRIDRLNEENSQLRQESSSLRKLADTLTEREKIQVRDMNRQLDAANEKIQHLHQAMSVKSEECATQTQAVEGLLKEIAMKHGRERELMLENEDLNIQLEEAVLRQSCLQTEMNQLQDEYADLRGMFCEAEEELTRYRQNPPRSHSMDSLYDSLASELENSDSGFSSTPANSARGMSLRLELDQVASTSGEVDVPSTVLAEILKKKSCILPKAPPQTPESSTPQSETAATPLALELSAISSETVETVSKPSTVTANCAVQTTPSEETKNILSLADCQTSPAKKAILVGGASCDASTSTVAVMTSSDDLSDIKHIGLPLHQSTPKLEKGGLLQFSSLSSSVHSSPRGVRRLGLSALSRENDLSPISSSEDSLDDYVAPKMGEPGMPGSRDLDFSLKMLKARRQVEKDFAQFRRRKGLPPSTFFPSDSSAKRVSTTNRGEWTDYSVSCAQPQHRASLSIALGSPKAAVGQGVVTRAELLSPQSSPSRTQSPSFSNGLAALSPSLLGSELQPRSIINQTTGVLRRFL